MLALFFFLISGLFSFLALQNYTNQGPFLIGLALMVSIVSYTFGLNELINMIIKPFIRE